MAWPELPGCPAPRGRYPRPGCGEECGQLLWEVLLSAAQAAPESVLWPWGAGLGKGQEERSPKCGPERGRAEALVSEGTWWARSWLVTVQ